MAKIKQGPAPEDHYTLIPNSLSRSPDISPRAKVVYIYLKSHRDGWDISTERVADAIGMSKETVVKAIQDLVDAGYVLREKVRGDGGTFSGWEYEVLSWPGTVVGKTDHGKNPWSEKSDVGENRPHKKTIPSKKTKEKEDQPPIGPPEGDTSRQPSESKRATATRLPEGWEPSPDLRAEMSGKCPAVDQDWELAKFRNHWEAAPDRTGRKLSWDATYRNWIIRAAERPAPRGTQRRTPGTQVSDWDRKPTTVLPVVDAEVLALGGGR